MGLYLEMQKIVVFLEGKNICKTFVTDTIEILLFTNTSSAYLNFIDLELEVERILKHLLRWRWRMWPQS